MDVYAKRVKKGLLVLLLLPISCMVPCNSWNEDDNSNGLLDACISVVFPERMLGVLEHTPRQYNIGATIYC